MPQMRKFQALLADGSRLDMRATSEQIARQTAEQKALERRTRVREVAPR